MTFNKPSTSLLALAIVFSLTACGAKNEPLSTALDSMQGKKAATQTRLTTAAAEAIAAGRTSEALMHHGNLYKTDRKDADNALNYAQLLRRTGKSDEALKVLSPFVKKKPAKDGATTEVHPMLLNEYAANLIERGDLTEAQKIIDRVLADEKAKGQHADAMNLLGVALDAQGRHKEAETMFKLALEGWNGNPTTVMNNLALCLASQAKFDEALTTLRQALVIAPDKQEIARNIQIVSELHDNIVAKPVNIKKN